MKVLVDQLFVTMSERSSAKITEDMNVSIRTCIVTGFHIAEINPMKMNSSARHSHVTTTIIADNMATAIRGMESSRDVIVSLDCMEKGAT